GHLADQLFEGGRRHPAELLSGLGRVAQQRLDFGRAEIAWIDPDDHVARFQVDAIPAACDPSDLVDSFTFPGKLDAELASTRLDEVPYRVLHPGRDHEVLGLVLLQ